MSSAKIRFYLITLITVIAIATTYLSMRSQTQKDIVFIGSAPLSGPTKYLGVEYTNGINSYFRYANENKILKNRKIIFDIEDDQYEPFFTKSNITEMLKQDNVYGVLGVVGTPTAEVAMKIALSEKTPFLMPLSGAEFLYTDNPLIFTMRPSYRQEADAMVKYMSGKQIKRVAIVYQNDSFGLTALNALTEAIKNHDIKLVTEGVYNRNTLSIGYALNEILKYRPDAVVIAGTHKPSIELIKQAEAKKLNALFFNFSFAGYEPIYQEAKRKGVNLSNIFITQVVPPLTGTNGSVEEFKSIYKKYYPNSNPNSIAYEGFLAAKFIVGALKNSDASKSDFMSALSSAALKNKDSYNTYILRLNSDGGVLAQ